MKGPVRGAADKVRSAMTVKQRIEALEAEVQECRQMNLRLAELTDLVTELLLPVAERDEARIAEALKGYHESVGRPPA